MHSILKIKLIAIIFLFSATCNASQIKLPTDKKWWHYQGQRTLSDYSPGPEWKLGFGDNWAKNTRFWHKDGIIKRSTDCPGDGWIEGKLGPGNQLNKSWYNNGVKSTLLHESSGLGWVPGRLKRK